MNTPWSRTETTVLSITKYTGLWLSSARDYLAELGYANIYEFSGIKNRPYETEP